MSKYAMDSDWRSNIFGIAQLLAWHVGPKFGEDFVREAVMALAAEPGGTSTSGLCEFFELTVDDRRDLGFPFFVKHPRRNVILYSE